MARSTISLIEKSRERPSQRMAGTIRLEKDKTRPNMSEVRLEPGISFPSLRVSALLTFNFVPAEFKKVSVDPCSSFKLDTITSETNVLVQVDTRNTRSVSLTSRFRRNYSLHFHLCESQRRRASGFWVRHSRHLSLGMVKDVLLAVRLGMVRGD